MGLILRNVKGSKLTWTEMDDNLTYLESLNGAGVVSTTYLSLKTLYDAGNLVPGAIYKITDYTSAYRSGEPIWIEAVTNKNFSNEGLRQMRIVKNTYYTVSGANKGVWKNTLSVAVNNIVVWGGRVFKNLTGSVGSSTNDWTLDATNWLPIALNDNTYYEDKIFDIKFTFYDFDFGGFYITEQSDNMGNVICNDNGAVWGDDAGLSMTDWGNINIINNKVKVGIYNNSNNGIISGNKIYGFISKNSNSGQISNNSNGGGIHSNSNGGVIQNNSNNGDIFNNSNGGQISNNSNKDGISSNTNTGGIYANSNVGFISSNSNIGDITLNSNLGSIDGNSNGGQINNNSNADFIQNNSNGGQISLNSNTGGIYDNSNGTNIYANSNLGSISANSNTNIINYNSNAGNIQSNTNKISQISKNSNNGDITANTSALTGPFSIQFNTNNGYISNPTITANITDTIVNK